MSSGPEDLDVRAYAAIAVALAEASSREEVLAAAGLDEDSWEAVEDRWQERLSRAIDEQDTDSGACAVPPLMVEYDAAITEARARSNGAPPMSLERFAEATRQLRRGADPAAAVRQLGVSFGAYLRASAHWTARMAREPDLAERFRLLTS